MLAQKIDQSISTIDYRSKKTHKTITDINQMYFE